jgi:hypothetical protein
MLKKFTIICSGGLLLLMTLSSMNAREAIYGPTELIYYDAEKAFNGYTLFSPLIASIPYTYLIDMEGNVCHMWKFPDGGRPEKIARLLENGNLVRAVRIGGRGSQVTYQEVDWEGNIVWQFMDAREGYLAHHDFVKIWNKNLKAHTFLIITGTAVSHEEAVAKGCDPKLRSSYVSSPDGIIEVDLDGNIVWEWNISDHLVQDVDSSLDTYGVIADHPEKLDPNFGGGRRGDWVHSNSLDYNEALDRIVFNNSTESEFYVIDHGATFVPGDPQASRAKAAGPAGDFIFRWGNPCVYDSGDCPSILEEGKSASNGHQQMFFTHDIQWIREGLPGAGNFLIFDNGARRPGETYSTVLEINPYDGQMETGKYVPEIEGGYTATRGRAAQQISNQIVWSYKSQSTQNFYSGHISGCQRLPNGNTLICSGRWGHFFEVTPEGECVWEYISPVTRGGVVKVIGDEPSGYSDVFRSLRYSPDYPGLKDKDLTPKGPITKLQADLPKASGPAEGGRGGKGPGKAKSKTGKGKVPQE